MKIKTEMLIGLLLVLLLATTASAALDIEDQSVILNVNYDAFRTEDQTNISLDTSQFTLKNTGTENATATIKLEGIPSNYAANTITLAGAQSDFSGKSKDVSLAANTSTGVKINLKVPHDKNSGEETIGYIKAYAPDGTVKDSVALIQKTSSMLIFKKISIKYTDEEDKSQEDKFDTKDEFTLDKNVKVGAEIEFTFQIENLFSDKDYEDSGIDGIELTIDVSDNDILPDDFEENYELDDLEADKNLEYKVKFIPPMDADTGDYTFEFTLEGEDGKNAKHSVKKEVTLTLARMKDDVRITKTELVPAAFKPCENASSPTLKIELTNYGNRDQKYTAVTVYNSELGVNVNIPEFELEKFDDEDTWSKTLSLVLPKNLVKKTYPLEVNAYIKRSEKIDTKLVNLVVEECPAPVVENTPAPTQPAEEDEDEEVLQEAEGSTTVAATNVNAPAPTQNSASAQTTTTAAASTTASTGTRISSSAVVPTIEQTYRMEDFLIAGIIVVIVLLLSIIILFAVILFK